MEGVGVRLVLFLSILHFENMKRLFILPFLFLSLQLFAQSEDTTAMNKVVIHQDYRLSILARKEADINTALLKAGSQDWQRISVNGIEY